MISVVVPVYNAANFLAKTGESVQAQTFSSWELLLVDDGSKDDSRAIAQDLARQDSRIRTFSQKNAGASAARNHGLSEANPAFPYALCLDSDDLLLPDALQSLKTLLEAHPASPAACGFLLDVNADGSVIAGFDRLESLTDRRGIDGVRLIKRAPGDALVFGDMCFHNHIITPGQVLLRKTAVSQVGAFDLSLAYVEDHDLWWRLTMQIGPIAVTPEPVLLYRHHGASISGNPAARRRGGADFRWNLLTSPLMTPAQRRTARIGYFYRCTANLGFGGHYIRKGEIKHGLKHAALGLRDMALYARDLARALKVAAKH